MPGVAVRLRVSDDSTAASLLPRMLIVTLVSGFWVDPQVAAARAGAGVPINTLAADDERRVRFGWLHGLSSTLMAVTTLGGLVLCYWETRE